MTINEANKLLKNINFTHAELLDCLESLCKEYGYIQGMTIAKFQQVFLCQTLVEIQNLIDQLKEKLKS